MTQSPNHTPVAAAHAAGHVEAGVAQTALTIAASIGTFFTLLLLGCRFLPTIPLIH